MPEGPSILILKEQIDRFTGRRIKAASGNADLDMALLQNKTLLEIRVWGKQLFFIFNTGAVRIHLLLFGSYSIGKKPIPTKKVRLQLNFTNDNLYFYACSVKYIGGSIEDLYDWKADVMSDSWDPRRARRKVEELSGNVICDVLLNQEIFSGVGNIIKNEVLYRTRVHPETLIENIPPLKLGAVIREARNYSFDFLKWKKENTLKRHWLAHSKKICKRCNLPFTKKYCGKTKRRTFFCSNCQILYE